MAIATWLHTIETKFEVLDKAIASGRFDEERVLGMVRHLIQHRPRFKVLLAGSHTLDEFRPDLVVWLERYRSTY